MITAETVNGIVRFQASGLPRVLLPGQPAGGPAGACRRTLANVTLDLS